MKIKKGSKKGTEDLFKVEELEHRLELGYIDGACNNEVNGVCDTDVDVACFPGGGGGGEETGQENML